MGQGNVGEDNHFLASKVSSVTINEIKKDLKGMKKEKVGKDKAENYYRIKSS